MGESLKQPIVVDVRLGAGGNVGYDHVAKSPADGYTLVLAGNSLLTNPSLYANLSYDVARDLTPVTQYVGTSMALVVHPTVPARSAR